MRVLIVDDNEASAKTMGWMIELMGHDIRLAPDGQATIALAQSYLPDAVLLDIGLPTMDGYDVCRRMRENPLHQNTVFIAQTGWGQQEHRQRSKEAGFHHHMVKPVDIEKLTEIIGSIDKKLAPDKTKTGTDLA